MIFVKGPLETLNYFVDCMIDCLEENSYFIFDISKPDFNGLLSFVKRNMPKKMVTFNNMAIDLSLQDGRNFWEMCQINVFDYLVDHPINYLAQLNTVPDNRIENITAVTIDRNHQFFLKKYCPNIHTFFLPHGGTVYDTPFKAFSQRAIDILYTGSNQEILTAFPAIMELPESGQQLYLFTYQLFMDDTSYTAEAAVECYFSEIGLQPTDDLFLRCVEYVHCSIERNARCHYKTQIMTHLAKSGFSMEIYGDNWDFLSVYNNVHIHPRVTSEECIRLMTDAKICLNFMPWFKDGSHERIYNAMLNGAVCVTDPSIFLEETHQDLDTIAYFHLNDLREAAYKIDMLLSRPDLWEDISHRARTVSQRETWQCRLEVLYNI